MESKPLRVNRSLEDDPWPLVIAGAVSIGFSFYLFVTALLSVRAGGFFGGLSRVILAAILAAPIFDRYKKG